MFNKAGKIVSATKSSIAYALLELGGNLNNRLNAWLVDGGTENVWPIVGFTYFIIRKKSHPGSCEQRKHAMRFLYDFYHSAVIESIALNLGFATLPIFVRNIVMETFVGETTCSDGSYALPEYRRTKPYLLSTSAAVSALSAYQTVYTSLYPSVDFLTTHESDSDSVWKSFVNIGPDLVTGAFTIFTSSNQKNMKYNDPKVYTAPFAQFAVMPIYHVFEFQKASNISLRVTASILTGILVGKIQYWNHSEIRAANDVWKDYLPNKRIRVVVRNDPCDENAIISRFLGIVSNNTYSSSFTKQYDISVDGNKKIEWKSNQDVEFIFAKDNIATDSLVSHFDRSIGFYDVIGLPSSALASYCWDENCLKAPISLLSALNPIVVCQNDTKTLVTLNRGYSYDLMMSDDPRCYPIAATVDFSLFTAPDSPTCNVPFNSQEPYTDGTTSIARIRTAFASWLLNPDTSIFNVALPLTILYAAATPLTIRSKSFKSICDTSCGSSVLGYDYCGYRDCSWSDGDYLQEITKCNPDKQTRTVTYRLLNSNCRQGSEAKYPYIQPLSEVEVPCDYLSTSSKIGITSYVLCAIGAATALVFLSITFVYSKSSIFKMSQPVFLRIFIIGCVLLNLTIIIYVGENTDVTCMFRPWAVNISSTIMFAPLLAKLYRVIALYNAKLKKIKITDTMVLSLCGVIVGVDIILLILWTFVSTPKMKVVNFAYSNVIVPVENKVCSTNLSDTFEVILVVWKAILLAAGVYFSIRAWNIPSKLSEAKHFAIAIYNIAVVGGIAYFVSYLIVNSSSDASVLLRVFGLFISSTVAVVVILVPKIWDIHNGNAKIYEATTSYDDSSKSVRHSMSSQKSYAEEDIQPS